MKTRRQLTDRQYDLLVAIEDFWEKHGYSPSVAELKFELDVKGNRQIYRMLAALRDDGFITWEKNKNRTIRILPR